MVSGRIEARTSPSDITLFDSIGTGAQDVAVAAVAIRKAREQGIGIDLPIPPPTTRHR